MDTRRSPCWQSPEFDRRQKSLASRSATLCVDAGGDPERLQVKNTNAGPLLRDVRDRASTQLRHRSFVIVGRWFSRTPDRPKSRNVHECNNNDN